MADGTTNPATLTRRLICKLREDPTKFVYPLCEEFPPFRNVPIEDLLDCSDITNGNFQVSHKDDGMQCIHNIINPVPYHPYDTDVNLAELANLEYFQGVPNIVQPVGIVVFRNPYMTSRRDQPLVFHGILMHYYYGGPLKGILADDKVAEYDWVRWGSKLRMLRCACIQWMHTVEKTHLDIKLSNVVLDAEGNAVLIDISGIGDITYEWLAPELHDILQSPADVPFERRRWNDTRAFGNLLPGIAAHAGSSLYAETVKLIASWLLAEDTQTRMT